MIDLASLGEPMSIPYETREVADLIVGYNLRQIDTGALPGLQLTLYLRNTSKDEIKVEPTVVVTDRNGILIKADSFESYTGRATMIAGAPLPPTPVDRSESTKSTSQGTITNLETGRSVRYEAETRTSPAGPLTNAVKSYAQGVARRKAHDAASNRDSAQLQLKWAESSWLRQSYSIPPGTATGGAIHLQKINLIQLPLTISVRARGRDYTFTTATGVQ
jgi:hypothetical protein